MCLPVKIYAFLGYLYEMQEECMEQSQKIPSVWIPALIFGAQLIGFFFFVFFLFLICLFILIGSYYTQYLYLLLTYGPLLCVYK